MASREPSAASMPPREEMFALLDKLSRDSLDQPLADTLAYPEQGEISATFARLFDLIEQVTA